MDFLWLVVIALFVLWVAGYVFRIGRNIAHAALVIALALAAYLFFFA